MENIDEYVDLVTDFCLNIGIRRQLDAFRGLYTFVVTCSVCTRIYTLEWYAFMWKLLAMICFYVHIHCLQ